MGIEEFKKRFDPALKNVLDRNVREMRSLTQDLRMRSIVLYAQKLAMSGGKRIRPYLAFLAYRAAGGKDWRVVETLAGLELFHAFALVHDDIMDRGSIRHGLATANRRFGDAQAILVGDLLFNWASRLLAPSKAQPIFAKMVDEVILGQMLDVDAPRRKNVTDRFIQDKMRLKTASYTFIRPMQVGVALSLTSPTPPYQGGDRGGASLYDFCEKFGLPLGLAFQIQDDLLDLTASSKQLGKQSMNDIMEGQKTVFTQFLSQTPKHRATLSRLQGKTLTAKDRTTIKKMLEESGAIEYGKTMVERYFAKAKRAVERSGLKEERQKPFLELIEYVRLRKA